MTLARWLRPLAARLGLLPNRSTVRRSPRFWPGVVALEDRTVPATITVTSSGDTAAPDGGVTLREAITSLNTGQNCNTDVVATGKYGLNDTINFAIPATDPGHGHVYYQDDGVSGQLTMANVVETAATDDSAIPQRDGDYAFSWWSIRLNSVLPSIIHPVFIDGFSQGAGTDLAAHSGADGYSELLRIELDGSAIPAATSPFGLTIAGGASIVQGLAINRFAGASSIGIEVTGAGDNRIWGNFIGTDISGRRLAGNAVANNLDPAVTHVGINVEGTSKGNLIGTYNTPGSLPGNVVCGTAYGISFYGPGTQDRSTGGQNVASGNTVGVGGSYAGKPVTYSDNGTTRLLGNAIGISTSLYAHDDIIGTGAPTSNLPYVGNLVSGNIVAGVVLGGGGNQLAGEAYGTVAGNTITHNARAGIVADIDSQNCLIANNEIADNGLIGDTRIDNAPGVWIFDLLGRGAPTGITVSQNSIHDNTGLGIDLGGTVPNPPYSLTTTGIAPDGPTPNDAPNQAAAPNHYQNHPVLLSVTTGPAGFGTTITGAFHSTPSSTFRLEFFDNSESAIQYFLGSVDVTTDAAGNLATISDGSITYDAARQENTFTVGLPGLAMNLTATATNLGTGDTSELSPEVQLPIVFAGEARTTEGQSATFQGGRVGLDPNNEPLTFSWDLNRDGVFGDATGLNPTVSWAQLVALGFGDGPSGMHVLLKVSDDHGDAYIDDGEGELIVDNAPPIATVSGPLSAVAGEVLNFTLTATDPSAADQAAGFTYAIDWDGDGTTDETVTGAGQVLLTHAYAAAGSYVPQVTATDKDGGTSLEATTLVAVNAVTAANLRAAVSPTNPVTLQVSSVADAQAAVQAINDLAAQGATVDGTVTLDLAPITYGGLTVNVPDGMTLVLGTASYAGGEQATIDPDLPSLTVASGNVIARNLKFVTTGDAPTILVTGGHLTLRDDVIEESDGFAEAAILVTGGAVDLGTEADLGGNVLNANGPGTLVLNQTATAVSAFGNHWESNGAAAAPGPLVSGSVTWGAAPAVTVTGGSFVYDEQVHPAAGLSATGSGGARLGTPSVTYSYRDDDGNWHLTGNNGTDAPLDPGYYRAVAYFAGTDDYQSASASADITIAYAVRSLTDMSKAFKAGRAIPIKVMLTDADGNDVSSAGIDVTALRLEKVNADGSETQVSLADAGNSNSDDLFRYDSSLGGYIFNLSTKGLTADAYDFVWTAEGDPTDRHLSFTLV